MSLRGQNPKLSVAPMMDRTDRHFRYFMRHLTRHTLLYTQMITAKAIIHGDRKKLLGFDAIEKPLSLQLGGDDPEEMALCAKIAEDHDFDEVNINVGCPSSRVQSGNFGACLMATPHIVAECVDRMRSSCKLPVTVKHRIGIDEIDQYEDMANFVRIVSAAGADRFTVHARKAWLKGLSPKENRTIPPLRYSEVHRLKTEFPSLQIEINGGIRTLEETSEQLKSVDAVMIGRAAYENPWIFSKADSLIFGKDDPNASRSEVGELMLPYVEQWMKAGGKMNAVTRHMLQLYAHRPGAKHWKRVLGEASAKNRRDLQSVRELLKDPVICS